MKGISEYVHAILFNACIDADDAEIDSMWYSASDGKYIVVMRDRDGKFNVSFPLVAIEYVKEINRLVKAIVVSKNDIQGLVEAVKLP